jgi:hypothetical protein
VCGGQPASFFIAGASESPNTTRVAGPSSPFGDHPPAITGAAAEVIQDEPTRSVLQVAKPLAPSVLSYYTEQLELFAKQRAQMRDTIAKWWTLMEERH